MDDMIYCEFLKLKRSKIWLIVFLGTMITPLLAIVMGVKSHFSNPGNAVDLFNIYDDAFMFLMLLFGPLVFSIIASYLFSREYTEKTLKTLFVVPISKKKFLIGKFIALFICIFFLMILSWAEILILSAICNIAFGILQFNLGTALFFLFKTIFGSVLLYAAITPFAFLAMYTKGFVIPIIAASVIALGNVVLTGSPIAGFFPWTSPYLLLSGRLKGGGSTPGVALTIIGCLCLLSILTSIVYFQKEDIK